MYEELIERLRDDNAWKNCDFDFIYGWMHQAADAIEELQRLVDANKTSRWISVEERLPDQSDNGLYICLIVGGEYDQLSWYELCDFAEGRFWTRDSSYDCHVTHWMPLPEPPKEE